MAGGEGRAEAEVELLVDRIVVDVLDHVVSDLVGVGVVAGGRVDHGIDLADEELLQVRIPLHQVYVALALDYARLEPFVLVVLPDKLYHVFHFRSIQNDAGHVQLSEVVLVKEDVDFIDDQNPFGLFLVFGQFL